jgi:hypothetical protein
MVKKDIKMFNSSEAYLFHSNTAKKPQQQWRDEAGVVPSGVPSRILRSKIRRSHFCCWGFKRVKNNKQLLQIIFLNQINNKQINNFKYNKNLNKTKRVVDK